MCGTRALQRNSCHSSAGIAFFPELPGAARLARVTFCFPSCSVNAAAVNLIRENSIANAYSALPTCSWAFGLLHYSRLQLWRDLTVF